MLDALPVVFPFPAQPCRFDCMRVDLTFPCRIVWNFNAQLLRRDSSHLFEVQRFKVPVLAGGAGKAQVV